MTFSDYREAVPELVGLLRPKKTDRDSGAVDAANFEDIGDKADEEEGGDVLNEDEDEGEGAEAKSQAADEEQLDASMLVLESGEEFSVQDYIDVVSIHFLRLD